MRFDRATDDQTPGTEVTAKRLAEALERIAATGQSHVDLPSITDAATRDQTTAGEGDLAEPVATDQPAQPPDGALEPSPPDHAGAAVVVLDAHGQVIGRTQEPARDEKYGSGASPDREMAEPVQAETRAPLRSVTDATLEGITRAFAMVPSSANQPTTGTEDLELIHGIGPVYADALVSLGLNTFASIASLDEADIERIEGLVGPIRSRIERDRWREHAQSLDEAARASDEAVDPSSSATVEEP
jgi:predicted flap endonuclease-1-like 5' DNA nuclease